MGGERERGRQKERNGITCRLLYIVETTLVVTRLASTTAE